MMLFMWMPVPGTTIPAPSPFVHVTEQARPSASMTVRWAVEPIRDASSRAPNAGSPSPSTNSAVRAACAEPLDRVAELGLALEVAFAQQRPVGRVERPHLWRRTEDRLEQVDDLGLLGVDDDPVAGERRRRRGEVGEGERAPAPHRRV